MKLLLKSLVWHTPEGDVAGDLRLRSGRIVETGVGLAPGRRERVLELAGCRALPGLINGHDHLSLNLLPHLGDPPYPSLYRFAEEIYRPESFPIRETLRVAVRDRLLWGGYKNLISGVTTVVHHDPLPRGFFARGFPVRVLRRFAWSHSLRFGADLPSAHARSAGRRFIIHAAEGVDEECRREVDRLEELGVLDENTVLVHGIAVSASQRLKLEQAGVSLIWCPASNLRLYGRTAAVAELKERVRVALGTDSTLTGSPTLLDEARAAAATGLATGDEILSMVTAGAARVFGLEDRGRIGPGAAADLTVVPDPGAGAAAALLAARPGDLVLVVVRGRPRLARPALAEALDLGPPNGSLKDPAAAENESGQAVWLAGDPRALKRRIESAAGREAAAANPLWSMLEALG